MSAANHTSPGQEDQRVGTPTSADTARQQALEGFRAGGGKHLNCAQSVLLYCLLRLGMDTQPLAAARYLGGGVARQGLTCGLLLGCALGIGARDAGAGGAPSPALSVQQLQQLTERFVRRFGSSSCNELTGCDMTTTKGMEAFRQPARSARCDDMLQWVLEEVGAVLGIRG